MPTPVPMRFSDTRLLWTCDDVYSAAECRTFVERIETWGPTLATNNPAYRDQDRVVRDDVALAADLFDRLRPVLPAQVGPLTLVGLNERLRFYRYQPLQRFAPHTDHWYQPNAREISLLSVLVYFNDSFSGGATRFMEQLDARIQPKPGLAAIFQHKVRHEGEPVTHGRKYAMRTDVMYRAPEDVELTFEEF